MIRMLMEYLLYWPLLLINMSEPLLQESVVMPIFMIIGTISLVLLCGAQIPFPSLVKIISVHLVTQRMMVQFLSTVLITHYGMEFVAWTLLILAVITLDYHGSLKSFAKITQKILKSWIRICTNQSYSNEAVLINNCIVYTVMTQLPCMYL